MIDDNIKLGVPWKNLSKEGKKPHLSGRAQETTWRRPCNSCARARVS